MTDPEEIEEVEVEEPEAEQEFPVDVGPGCFVFRDWDFLDPANEVQGLIGVQSDPDGGLWRLMGLGEGASYRQVFEKIGGEPKKPAMTRVK